MTRPADAHTLARLLSGYNVNGEIRELSRSLRPMGELLAGVSVEDSLTGPARQEALAASRLPLWQTMMTARPNREELAASVASIDPGNPRPELDAQDDDEPEDGWGPIRLGALPPAEPFPLRVLPPAARDLAEAAAESIACPVDFPAFASLAAASGSIGRSVILRVKDGYYTSASLYAALVGSPSTGKSPALGAALRPLRAISQALHERWYSETEGRKKTNRDERGDEPRLGRILTSDPTTEALGPILAKNPRGLTVTPDEMTKWVLSMDQYKGGRGGDRPFYLSAWSGEAILIDRAKYMQEPIVVPHPYLTVVGGMTPDMLSALSEGKGREDGFMARFLFTYPEHSTRRYSEKGIAEPVAEEWKRLVQALWDRPLTERGGKSVPHVVELSMNAKKAWIEWCQAHYAEQAADGFPGSMEGPWGKLEAYAARLALILHLMHLAADPTRSAGDNLPDIPRSIVDEAARLVAYFKSHTLRVYATMGGKPKDGGDDVRALIRWILRSRLSQFSKRDIERNFDRFKDDPTVLVDALNWMIEHNLIRPHEEPEGVRRSGRKRSPAFDVNPELEKSSRFQQFR